jgi:hypothetical protein
VPETRQEKRRQQSDIDWDAVYQLFFNDPFAIGRKSEFPAAADKALLIPASYKAQAWKDKFWNEFRSCRLKRPNTEGIDTAIPIWEEENGRDPTWVPSELCTYDDILAYVKREITGNIEALQEKYDRWDSYCRLRFKRSLPRFRPTVEQHPDLDYSENEGDA